MSVQDIRTVMWKEVRELADTMFGGSRAQILALGVFAVIFGIMPALRGGAGWLEGPAAILSYAFIGALFLMGPVADVFAGERERHTLETLLSTRLDDSSILLGKLLGILVPVWVATALVYAAAIVAMNVAAGGGHLLLPPGWAAAATLGAIVLLPGLTASIGVFISMRSDTVRKASQMLGLVVMALGFLPMIAFRVLPHEWVMGLPELIQRHSPLALGLGAAGTLLVVEIGIVLLAISRFRRGRLALD